MQNKSPAEKNDAPIDWIRPEIRALKAYQVHDAGGMVKLDAMENPYRLPPELVSKWSALLGGVALNRYPDPAARALRERLRAVMQVPQECAIVLGNGSDELIQMLVMAVAGTGRRILSFDPGFVMYSMIARFAGLEYTGVALDTDFDIDLDATLDAIERTRPAIVFIAYPNNPTGNLFSGAAIDRIIESAPGLVVIDEAYHPFAQASYMDRLGRHDNLLVMRTVSKMGLAGLRLGLLCGPPELIAEIDKIRLPYNVNVLTQQSVSFALDNSGFLDGQAELIRADRESLYSKLKIFDALEVFPSDANFILFRLKQGSADRVFEALQQKGILIRNLNAPGALHNCLRVTVGTPEENQAFLSALEQVLGE